MKAIGHGPLMGELDGWLLAMTENSFLKVIGKGIAAGSNMTTVGTGNVRGIAIGTTTTTISEARASSAPSKVPFGQREFKPSRGQPGKRIHRCFDNTSSKDSRRL